MQNSIGRAKRAPPQWVSAALSLYISYVTMSISKFCWLPPCSNGTFHSWWPTSQSMNNNNVHPTMSRQQKRLTTEATQQRGARVQHMAAGEIESCCLWLASLAHNVLLSSSCRIYVVIKLFCFTFCVKSLWTDYMYHTPTHTHTHPHTHTHTHTHTHRNQVITDPEYNLSDQLLYAERDERMFLIKKSPELVSTIIDGPQSQIIINY